MRQLREATFYGTDVDPQMVRLATMNLTLRGLDRVRILRRDALTRSLDRVAKAELGFPVHGFDVILANPPFSGRLDGDLCDMDRHGLQADDPIASELPFVGVENVESTTGTFNFDNGSRVGNQRSTTFRFDERHVLYAKLRPYLNKVATPGFAGRCSTELVPLLPRVGVDREFLAYLLRRQETVDYVMASVTGARMPRTDMNALMSLPMPLPPLDEQRRIVGILNQAAKIERLRKQAQERLREFIPALFIPGAETVLPSRVSNVSQLVHESTALVDSDAEQTSGRLSRHAPSSPRCCPRGAWR